MNFAEFLFIFFVFAVTTAAAYAVTRGAATIDSRSIMDAVRGIVDWAGTFAVFFVANVIVGAVVIFAIRALTPRFVSLYALRNTLFLILSAAQAFVFQSLWRSR
jgi:hypothetical protein